MNANSTWKRRIGMLFILCMALVLLPVTALAEDADYTFDSDTGAMVINTAAGVTAWGGTVAPEAIVTMTVSDAVTELPQDTFAELENLESVTFKGDITVGSGSFSRCPALKTVAFEGESTLNDAFRTCPSLSTLTFAKKTALRGNPFYIDSGANTDLKELVFPAGSTLEYSACFNGYSGLESVTFKGDVSLGGTDFSNCSALKTLVFEGKSTMMHGAFRACPSLETVVFKGESTVKDGVFVNCPSLTTLTFEKKTAIADGALAVESENTKLKELVFPAGSTVDSGSGLFSRYTALESVTFQGDIKLLGGNFMNCSALKKVVFEGESTVASTAFSGCPSLETLTFGKKTAISVMGFSASNSAPNTKLKELVFPAGSTVADSSLFQYYTALESVTFQGNISVGGGNFCICPALKKVVFEGESTVKDGVFGNCPSLETLTFGKKTAISGGVFGTWGGENTKLKELIFPVGSTVADSDLFNNYTALESVTFQGEITVGRSNFQRCSALKTVVFEGNAGIKDDAFMNCPALAKVIFKKNAELSKNTFGNVSIDRDTNNKEYSAADNVMVLQFASETPPSFPDEVFGLLKPENITISVPSGSEEAYQAELRKNDGSDLAVTYNIEYTDRVTGYQRFAVTVEGSYASDSGAGKYAEGDTVYIHAGNRNNYSFKGWISSDPEITINDADSEDANFIMPAGDVTVTAAWKSNGGGSGSGGSSTATKYTLTFDSNGGSEISSISKTSGTTVDLADYAPTKDGYTFDGWYTDAKLTDRVTSVKLTKDTTVYAKWTKNAEPAPDPELPFTDVKSGDWFYDDVAYVFEQGLMNGTDSTTFSPNLTTTRGMIVTILYRMENSPAVSAGCPFTDVKAGAYYEAPIAWAAANGIVNGYSAEQFGPDDNITREQMAAILYRYAQYKGYDVTETADLTAFADAGSISEYAKVPMQWANAVGLVTGTDASTLAPAGNATRCQAAAMIHRLCENIAK